MKKGLIILVSVAVVGGLGYYLYTRKKTTKETISDKISKIGITKINASNLKLSQNREKLDPTENKRRA